MKLHMSKFHENQMKICFILLSGIFFSCQQELTHPLTVKGMQLGKDYDEQISIAEKNGICTNDLKDRRCQYKITETVYARPKIMYSLYEGKKVLGQVDLMLNSPYSFPTVTDQEGNLIAEYPSIRKSEVEEVITMYKIKYGKGDQNVDENSGVIIWTLDDLIIRLEYYTTNYGYAYQIHPQIRWAFEKDAFITKITYQYAEEKRNLLKHEKTHNGEVIGNNI
jgi:hypothetical protein